MAENQVRNEGRDVARWYSGCPGFDPSTKKEKTKKEKNLSPSEK
jgi:hypothetical protein